MLQIHDILENFPKEVTPDLLETKRIIKLFDGACFDFGEISAKIADDKTYVGLVDYAYELAQEDQFELAYESVSYCWEGDNVMFNCFCAHPKQGNLAVLVFVARKLPFKLLSIGILRIHDFGKLPKQGERVCAQTSSRNLWCANKSSVFNEKKDTYFTGVTFRIIALTVMRGAKHFRTRTVEVGEKLNKKREKRGLPKIMPFHTVYFDVGGKEYSADGTPKGLGAQKRMHWRRGHFRRLSTGKTIHVRACMINDFELESKVEKPLYKIREKEPVE